MVISCIIVLAHVMMLAHILVLAQVMVMTHIMIMAIKPRKQASPCLLSRLSFSSDSVKKCEVQVTLLVSPWPVKARGHTRWC